MHEVLVKLGRIQSNLSLLSSETAQIVKQPNFGSDWKKFDTKLRISFVVPLTGTMFPIAFLLLSLQNREKFFIPVLIVSIVLTLSSILVFVYVWLSSKILNPVLLEFIEKKKTLRGLLLPGDPTSFRIYF